MATAAATKRLTSSGKKKPLLSSKQQQPPSRNNKNRCWKYSPLRMLLCTLVLAASLIAGIIMLMSVVHIQSNNHHNKNTALWQILSDFGNGGAENSSSQRKRRDNNDDAPEGDDEVRGQKQKQQHRHKHTRHRDDDKTEQPHYHKLNCEEYGGPTEQEAQEMVYWKDIPSDSTYISPFKAKIRKNKKEKKYYMTFEPDGGGWNNIRMAMETVVGLAIATGRTLVLPAEQRMYLLAKGRGSKIKTDFSFMDFFPIQELIYDNDALDIITMEEFLQTEAMTGHLYDKFTGKVSFPPDNNRTNWNGQDVKILKEWLRNVTMTPLWSPGKCLAVFPDISSSATDDHDEAAKRLLDIHAQIKKDGMLTDEFLDNPIPINSTTKQRMHESLAKRQELCIYDEKMQFAPVLHFMCYHKMRVRLLTHFYAFLFFENWFADIWLKRFMRDHMRYIDELQCAAARIVAQIRKHVLRKNKGNNGDGDGEFDTFHIRRGDFQFKQTRIDADKIYENVKDILTENATVFVATDERDKTFFNPLKQHYEIFFLDDFMNILKDVNPNHYGMIDQLVASRGRIFFGCWHSTFTGFITRMRGYHSVKDNLPGSDDGLLPNTYYYVPKETAGKGKMHRYAPLMGAFFNREFPTSWRQIDFGVGKLPDLATT